ncbi:MAG: TIGR00270 family protein [Candidatus Aenigmarchaeota archaeon]|nr:TIGR00270 family protein [Candidatus Aenigmarchaeota archaeon]
MVCIPECETCGANSALVRAVIEDTYLNVCKRCAKLGNVLEGPVQVVPKKDFEIHVPEIAPDFKDMIKSARSSKQITRKELAERIGEKESVIARVEKGIRPPKHVASKLEKTLGIDLAYEEHDQKIFVQKTEEITLGDVLEIRVRKKA